MTDEIFDDVTEEISKIKHYEETFDDGLSNRGKDRDFADDGFIHISRGKRRFVFYNGQEKGMFTEKDVPRFARMVDNKLKKFKGGKK